MQTSNIKFRTREWKFLLLLATLISSLSISAYNLNIFKRINLITTDYLFKARGEINYSKDIVFVDMDEKSIDLIGRWPWTRDWHVALVSAFYEYKPKVILFDVFFSEPSKPEDDQAFAQAIAKAGNVYLPFAFDINYRGQIIDASFTIPVLSQYSKGTGYINLNPDMDGVIRKGRMLTYYLGEKYFYIPFKIGLDLLGIEENNISLNNHHIKGYKNGRLALDVPLDEDDKMLINWSGKWSSTFKHYSYIDVVRSFALIKENKLPLIDLSNFKDKIIIIGLTATGLWDIKPNPLEPLYPVVGIHGNLISSMLSRNFIRFASRELNILLILISGFLSAFIVLKTKFVRGSIFMLGLSCIYIWFAYSLFVNQNFILDIPYVVLNSLACYLIVNAYNEIMTNKEFKRLLLLSTTDGLTGLNIIRHFNMLYEAFFKEALAQKRELHIILIDIDNFKSINDTYGHQVGDLVLKEVAKIVKGGCRKLDIPARYGGEEFIIMAMDTNKFGALKLAERIRRNVEKNIVKAAEGNIKVTISIGVGGLRKEDQQKEDLIKRSDASLYESKRNGKNRVSYG